MFEFIEGTVEDNFDPMNWGRVRVHIFGRTKGLKTEELPFARVTIPLSSSLSISDEVCEIGTRVLMIMINEDFNSIVILGQTKHISQEP